METIDSVLKYIEIYTGCSEFNINRIRVLLERMQTEKVITKVHKENVYVQKGTKKFGNTLPIWAASYLILNNITYEQLSKRCRKRSTMIIRNAFCIAAYELGYSYSGIGKYLGMNHVTIMHCINKIKRK